jgi:hypothetical protein
MGVNVLALQRMLGHTSAKMTLDSYTDLFDDDLDAVAATLHAKYQRQSVPTASPPRGAANMKTAVCLREYLHGIRAGGGIRTLFSNAGRCPKPPLTCIFRSNQIK